MGAKTLKISICVPSYKRPKVETLNYLPFAQVWVAASECDEYKRVNPNAEIVKVPDSVQGNVCRVKNYILDDQLVKHDYDVCVLLDDDYKGVYHWQALTKHLVTADEFLSFIEENTRIADEWGTKFWGLNINQDKQVYREYAPFSTVSFIGGPFQAVLKGNPLRYDERLPLKEDYDFTLQNLNEYRKVVRLNSYFYSVKQAEQAGGCATYRNFEKEQSQLNLLQRKWGDSIIKADNADRSHNLKNKKTKIDFNPVMNSPIKGI